MCSPNNLLLLYKKRCLHECRWKTLQSSFVTPRKAVKYSDFGGGRPVHTSNSRKKIKIYASRYTKNVLPGCLFLDFFCKTFSKLLKLTLRKTLYSKWFLKNSFIYSNLNLYGYKLVKAVKRSELQRCSK